MGSYETRCLTLLLGWRLAGPALGETMLPRMAAARDALRARGVPARHLRLLAPADGRHAEWFWRREFGPAYRWLLAD